MVNRMNPITVCLVGVICLHFCRAEGVVHFAIDDEKTDFRFSSTNYNHIIKSPNNDGGSSKPLLVCYYTPTSYFPATRVPGDACTHIIYAFGAISAGGGSAGPNIAPPSSSVRAAWTTLTALRVRNPELKIMLSLQNGFPNVVGNDDTKMQEFANNSVKYLRNYQLDGVDMDWEYPNSNQKVAYAKFFTLMREAINHEARLTNRPALLLSTALPNSYPVSERSFDIPTISSAVDFGMAMTYDFHLYNMFDKVTGYNSPLFTPKGEIKYFSTAAMAQYYLSKGMPVSKFLIGLPTYGRSWQLASSSIHGLHAPAVGKGAPGPYRHLVGVYLFPDVCMALEQGATSVYDENLGAVYLYQNTTWVAYDDVRTIKLKSNWALSQGLAGVGVWAMPLDDIDNVCQLGPLPLIRAMADTLASPPSPHDTSPTEHWVQ